jgi:CRP/FNR family transcriptional regulator
LHSINRFYMHQSLVNNIRKFMPLNDEAANVMAKYVKSAHFKKREFLVTQGQVCRSLYFVEKGCLRMFFNDDKATEQITQFAIDNWWLADYFSFADNKPSEYYLQAVENTAVLSIDALAFDTMLVELPQLERYFRMTMQKAVAASQLRIKYMYQLSKEEFYNHFVTSFPDFVQRVPQYMIASYLGLTPEYVSELRRKKR